MIGILYNKSDNVIIAIVENVVSHSDIEIIGVNSTIQNIDLSLTDYVLKEATQQVVGEVLADMSDLRLQLPPTYEKRLEMVEQMMMTLIQV
ncbi:hypothetical protein [Paenibacillus lutrae]|uniref:Uncharacterized protein n=1 Tax=Paenibacillus lutrae TaxID=2078573 RepID=A0A7X3FID9_9BACL|nr:hypothetical protein [Paenibacillus lutrae]MVP00346.1 hypothetical protein [Paenibacillus lutrae]